MPYKDPEKKRAHGARYRAENKMVLCAKERMRATALKAIDPESWRLKAIVTAQRFRTNHRNDEPLREKERARSRLYWQKIKDDPVVKQKNKTRVTAFLRRDLQYRLGHALRTRLNTAIRNRLHKTGAVRDLGCSLAYVVIHLERQFQPGMTWANWSLGGWHIDHIKPLKTFDLTDPMRCAAACHYSNLQPLWASENLAKGARYQAPLAAVKGTP